MLLFGRQGSKNWQIDRKLDLTDTIKDGARLFLIDEGIRRQLLLALTEDSKLHIQEVLNNKGFFSVFKFLFDYGISQMWIIVSFVAC